MKPPFPPCWSCLRPESFLLLSVEVGETRDSQHTSSGQSNNGRACAHTCKHASARAGVPLRHMQYADHEGPAEENLCPVNKRGACRLFWKARKYREHRTGPHSEEPGARCTQL